eukprot:scaffold6407_cov78-Cyclotella_meneghiniana.AAC.10
MSCYYGAEAMDNLHGFIIVGRGQQRSKAAPQCEWKATTWFAKTKCPMMIETGSMTPFLLKGIADRPHGPDPLP